MSARSVVIWTLFGAASVLAVAGVYVLAPPWGYASFGAACALMLAAVVVAGTDGW